MPEKDVRAAAAQLWRTTENQDAPSADRASDHAEARADEKQDLTSSLNFPLHWTTAAQSWHYLFDFGIACELLAPRPDDLVLDFAAGTSWASELLSRLAVRTVSIDLSVEMMRRGRQRLAADNRLVFREQASFVAARGQSLPFANDAFDGVLCMNALHHLPSYATALAEIYRVLKSGGRDAIAELERIWEAVVPFSPNPATRTRFNRFRDSGCVKKACSRRTCRFRRSERWRSKPASVGCASCR